MAVVIRAALPADLPGIRDVFRRASLSNAGDRDLLTVHPELLEWADGAIGEGRTRVAVGDGRVVGFATVLDRNGAFELEDLFVAPESMRRGVGRRLIEDVIAVARASRRVRVDVDANPHAQAFYTALGFVPLGDVSVEYGIGLRMTYAVG